MSGNDIETRIPETLWDNDRFGLKPCGLMTDLGLNEKKNQAYMTKISR